MPKESPGRIKALVPDPEPNRVEEDGTPVDTAIGEVGNIAPPVPGPDAQDTPPDPITIEQPVVSGGLSREEVVARMSEVLIPNGKRGVPTLVNFRNDNGLMRYVIIDANDGVIGDVLKVYKEHIDKGQEDFLMCVYDALKMKGVPRLYRGVSTLDLTKHF